MKVTRITLDSELGLIELTTGPGGDGNYVLLPIDIPPTAERYLRLPGEPATAEAPTVEGSLIAAGGWYSPGVPEKELNSYLAADTEPEHVSIRNGNDEVIATELSKECDGNCGAHVKPKWQEPETGPGRGERDGGFWKTDGPVRERHTGPATCPDPVQVFATDYGHGYRLTCPALPQWTRTINRYDLHRVPGLIANALGERKTVAVTIIEEP